MPRKKKPDLETIDLAQAPSIKLFEIAFGEITQAQFSVKLYNLGFGEVEVRDAWHRFLLDGEIMIHIKK